MKTKVSRNDKGIYLVELSGAMDLYGTNEFKELILKMIEKKAERFIISLKDVDNVNSSGLGALIFVSSTLKKLECPLVIVAPEGPALHALELTGLKGYFTIVPTLKEAAALVEAG